MAKEEDFSMALVNLVAPEDHSTPCIRCTNRHKQGHSYDPLCGALGDIKCYEVRKHMGIDNACRHFSPKKHRGLLRWLWWLIW